MNKYVNVPCAKCGKPFTEDDDVVVCPDCGAPHHRSCYLELGHCARQDQHTDGSTWQDPRQEAAPKENVTCPRCGAVNLPDAQYCATCGIPLDGSYQGPQPGNTAGGRQAGSYQNGGFQNGGYQNGGFQPGGYQNYSRPAEPQPIMTPMGPIYQDDDFDGVTAQEIAVFIGPNYRRYLSIFKMMRDSGHNFSFNWSAFFFNYCFLFYRKLYRPAIVVMSLVAMLFIPRLMYSSESIKYFLNVYMQVPVDYDLGLLGNLGTLISIINIVQLALMFVVASFSDRLYYNHVVREIKKLRSAAPSTLSQDQYLTMLAFNGRTNPRMGYGMALLSAAVVFGISYLITYQILATTML